MSKRTSSNSASKPLEPLSHFTVHHIGIAVQNLDQALPLYIETFGGKFELREKLTADKVELVFVKLANCRIELLAPTDSDGPLAKFLKRRGPGLHHIGYAVSDVQVELDRLRLLGYTLIDARPRLGAGGHMVAFLHPKSTGGVLVELITMLA